MVNLNNCGNIHSVEYRTNKVTITLALPYYSKEFNEILDLIKEASFAQPPTVTYANNEYALTSFKKRKGATTRSASTIHLTLIRDLS